MMKWIYLFLFCRRTHRFPSSYHERLLSWWRHQMETFSASLAICAGNSPAQRPVTGSFMFSLICVWIIGWENNREAGDLRYFRAHYDVIVMICKYASGTCISIGIYTVLVEGIKNGCPCIVEIRGTQGCALVGDPARAVGECRDLAKAQP